MKKEGVVLIGMAGAGKSTVGTGLAAALGYAFTDLDEYIKHNEGCGIQEIIDSRGDVELLRLEDLYMREIDLTGRVVAPGGSIIYIPDLMRYLRQHTNLVYLEDSFENLNMRLTNASTRGIVGWKSKTLCEIYDERRPLYLKYADITVTVTGKSPEQVTGEITALLADR
jgi:shikimate kinase